MATNTAGQTVSQSQSQDSPSRAFGKDVFDGTSITAADSVVVTTGFKPRYVRWENATDRTSIEWFEGMADNTCIKIVAAGTRTLETTNGGITVSANGFSVLQNATLAAILASKTCYWTAHG